jgi:hypothetical protein
MTFHEEDHFAGPQSGHRSERRIRPWMWRLGAFFLCCAGLMVLVVLFAVVTPDTSVYLGSQVPTSYLETARELGALEPDERPKFFYSDGIIGIKNGFYLVTDTKVAIYSEDGRDPPLTVIGFDEIATAELMRNESFIDDSMISIETKEDEYHAFPVSSEYDRDTLFFKAIEKHLDPAAVDLHEDDEM